MTHYLVPVTEELLEQVDFWRPVEGFRLHRVNGPWPGHPGVRLVEFDDDGADPALEGQLVEPVISREYDTAGHQVRCYVADRQVIACA